MNTQITEENAQESLLDFLRKADNLDSYKREEVDGTRFKKCKTEKGELYFLGDTIIGLAENQNGVREIEHALQTTNWDVLIPIICAVVEKYINVTEEKVGEK